MKKFSLLFSILILAGCASMFPDPSKMKTKKLCDNVFMIYWPPQQKALNELLKRNKIRHNYTDEIMNGKIEVGMNKCEVRASTGGPADINRTISKYGGSEQWDMGQGLYLYFENGEVSTIQDYTDY